jgi:hypothetical protein
MLKRTAFAVIAVLAIGSGIASAGPVNQRQRHERQRIYQGVRSGELTRNETIALARQQARLAAEEARYRRSGGGLSRWERADLQRDLHRASRNIYRQKHDAQNRW